jgi:acyl-CoA reductase-like NAD-dependent aldehyde dehydrogenase
MNYELLIDGHMVDTEEHIDVVNPATGEVFARCPRGDGDLLNQAVAATRRAQQQWRTTSIESRQQALSKLAQAVEEQREALAQTLTQEQGKILDFARFEIDATVQFLNYFAKQSPTADKVIEDSDTQTVTVTRQPLGVVGCITPWNFPLLQAAYKMAPAVLTGNGVIIKPAPTTPLTTLMFGQLIKRVFPAGLVNVITDEGELGPLISQHPGIDKVSVTGSTQTGRAVMASAAATLKPLTLELGGNDAAILLDDVDVDKVIPQLFAVSFINSGQVCIAIKRLYVPDSLYDEVCERMAELADAAKIGNGLDSESEYGPLQNSAQLERFHHYLALAERDGNIITRRQASAGNGYFAPFVVVRDINEGTPLVDEEPFTPILPILRYSSVDEAIERANNTEFGLGGSVWSSNPDRAAKVASRLECGTAWVNQHCAFGPHIPFGGIKQSGLGVEFAEQGIDEFTHIKVLSIAKG